MSCLYSGENRKTEEVAPTFKQNSKLDARNYWPIFQSLNVKEVLERLMYTIKSRIEGESC